MAANFCKLRIPLPVIAYPLHFWQLSLPFSQQRSLLAFLVENHNLHYLFHSPPQSVLLIFFYFFAFWFVFRWCFDPKTGYLCHVCPVLLLERAALNSCTSYKSRLGVNLLFVVEMRPLARCCTTIRHHYVFSRIPLMRPSRTKSQSTSWLHSLTLLGEVRVLSWSEVAASLCSLSPLIGDLLDLSSTLPYSNDATVLSGML